MDTYKEIQDELEELVSTPKLKFTESSLKKKKKVDLVTLCSDLGLDVEGTRAELIKRLVENKEEQVIEATSTVIIVKEESVEGIRI